MRSKELRESEEMVGSQIIDVRNKILSKENLLKIMNYLIKASEVMDNKIPESVEKMFKKTKIQFEINYENQFKNSGKTVSVFDEYKVIETARFSINNFEFGNSIEIILKSHDSYFKVSSPDKEWLAAKTSHIKEMFDEAPNQNKVLSKRFHQHNISNFFGVFVGSVVFLAVNSLPFVTISSINYATYIGIIGSMILGITLARVFLYEGLVNLYPSVEFNTAKEHLNRKLKIKKIIWNSAILVLLPLAISFISSLLF